MEPLLKAASVTARGTNLIDAWLVEAAEARIRRGQAFSGFLDEWNAEAGGIDEAELAAAAAEWPDLS